MRMTGRFRFQKFEFEVGQLVEVVNSFDHENGLVGKVVNRRNDSYELEDGSWYQVDNWYNVSIKELSPEVQGFPEGMLRGR